jgi:hypothetical protein
MFNLTPWRKAENAGILEVELAKRPEAQARRITVKT